MEQELSILAYNNGNQITVGIYSVLTVILAFIALRVARFSQGTHTVSYTHLTLPTTPYV